MKVGASVEVGAGFLGSGTKRAFSTEVTGISSFNVEASKTKSYSTTEKTDVSIEVPANTKITINLLRTVQDLEYKWKAIFKLLKKCSVKCSGNVRRRDANGVEERNVRVWKLELSWY